MSEQITTGSMLRRRSRALRPSLTPRVAMDVWRCATAHDVPLPATRLAAAADSADEDGTDVREAMGFLRPRDRELLYMAYWERLSGHEIAEILRIRPRSSGL